MSRLDSIVRALFGGLCFDIVTLKDLESPGVKSNLFKNMEHRRSTMEEEITGNGIVSVDRWQRKAEPWS